MTPDPMTPDPMNQDPSGPIPDRDLPPASRDRMRAHVAALADEPARVRRTAPLVAVACLTAVVSVGVAVLTGQDTGPEVVASGFPGTSAAEVAEIERGCAAVALAGAGDGAQVEGLGKAGITDTGETMRLRNLVRDQAGRFALVIGQSVMVGCAVAGTGDYRGDPRGLSGQEQDISVDVIESTPGTGGRPGTLVVAGRLGDPEIVRVQVSAEGRSAWASVMNGTYLVRFVLGADYSPPSSPAAEVRALTADGRGASVTVN
jgi:hypothetical protein